jgi:hypothetical protein
MKRRERGWRTSVQFAVTVAFFTFPGVTSGIGVVVALLVGIVAGAREAFWETLLVLGM